MASSSRGGEPAGAWWALAACVVTIVLAAGTRSSLAAFLVPIQVDLRLDRASVSFIGALAALTYGLAQPPLGLLAARLRARTVMLGGVLLMTLCGIGMATATREWQLFLFGGVLTGIGFAACSSVPAVVLLARWFERRLGLATGVMASAIPAGQSLFVPLAAALIPLFGWRESYAGLSLVLALVALPVLSRFAREPRQAPGVVETARAAIPPVGADIWLAGLGFFACGFTDQFVTLHLVALATDAGLDPLLAAGTFSLLLLFGIAGSVASGPLADARPPKYILAGMYLTRAASLPLLLLAGPRSGLAALGLFAVMFGVTYIGNQAAGARLIRDRYGVAAVGTLLGSLGLAHQVGGAIGIAAGGLSVTLSGGYGPAVLLCAGVALVGGLAQTFIPPARLASPYTVAPVPRT